MTEDLAVLQSFNNNFTELYQSANHVVETMQTDGQFHGLLSIETADFSRELSTILSSFNLRFIFRTHLFQEWSERYFRLLHSSELTNELGDNVQQRDDIDSQTVRLDSNIDFTSIERTSENLSNRLREVICQLYGLDAATATDIQRAIRRFGLMDGAWTICPSVHREDDPLSFTRHIDRRGPEPTIQTIDLIEEEETEEPQLSVEEIMSEEGSQDHIFTYTYSYDN